MPAFGGGDGVAGAGGLAERQGQDGAVLATEGVRAGYLPEVDILTDVSISVADGEIVTVIGPNGAGKSTLIKTIFGLLQPREGRILFRGEDISGLQPHNCTRRGMSYVPQLENVFKSLTVEENLEIGSLDRSRTGAQMDRMYELFPRLGERRRQAAGTMSGGERQMLAMARALMPDPELLLLDEPSAGLAPAFVEATFEQIERVNKSGVTIVMVEQNAKRALAMSDRGYVLDLGTNRFEGPGRELLEDPKVAELYLGGTGRLHAGEVESRQEGRTEESPSSRFVVRRRRAAWVIARKRTAGALGPRPFRLLVLRSGSDDDLLRYSSIGTSSTSSGVPFWNSKTSYTPAVGSPSSLRSTGPDAPV
jgi:neutral amino acid transport system ATP-binding protein